MESKRQKQIAELIRRNFSQVLLEEGSHIYGASVLVTVTEVKVSPDMSLAKIYLSVFNTENKQEPMLHLQEFHHKLKQSLAHRIRSQVRRIPDIALYLDDTIDEMYRVDSLFNRLYEENQMGSPEEEEGDGE